MWSNNVKSGMWGSVSILMVGLMAVTFVLSTPVFADDIGTWRKAVVKRIAKKHIYPRSAISREIEGKARVQVTLARSGEITNYEILEPTGESVLDKTIPKMMDKLNPFPEPPASMDDNSLTFVIPITWRLQ